VLHGYRHLSIKRSGEDNHLNFYGHFGPTDSDSLLAVKHEKLVNESGSDGQGLQKG